jgi:hypothetical protein
MYSVQGFLGVLKDTGSLMSPMGSIFSHRSAEGLGRFLELLLIKSHFVEGC